MILRWTLWWTAAWAFYYFAQLPFSLARNPLPANVPPRVAEMQASFLFEAIGFFAISIVIISAAIVTLIVVPYAVVVARNPDRRFWGEDAPMGRAMLLLAVAFVPLGVVLGATTPPLRTTVTLTGGSEPSGTRPAPSPLSHGRNAP
ncbi:MAG: hypothetical protein JWM87_485 [Candidatus Eremiobacteraeota bacterium]|nr:hypothetical protein [Candidatus Eremiobacteraeota bacterium]